MPCETFVEDAAEGEQVGSRVERIAAQLLWTCVARRTHGARGNDGRVGRAESGEMVGRHLQRQLLSEAEGRQAVVAAENAMNERVVAMKVELARLETLPPLVAEMVKPAEKIDSIRINRISGFGSGSAGGSGGSGAEGGSIMINTDGGGGTGGPSIDPDAGGACTSIPT